MIDAYVREKTDLYGEHSDFSCDDKCPRYGCRSNLVVAPSLLELYVQSRFLGVTVADLFNRAFDISPFTHEGLERVRIRFCLKKPCPFLDKGKTCGIYSVRPAACALFPEYLGLLGDRERRREYIAEGGIDHYPCVKTIVLSEARTETLHRLWRLHAVEICATEIYLFDIAGFSVDLREALLGIAHGGTGRIPYRKVGEALAILLAAQGLGDRIIEKIGDLGTDGGMRRYLSAMAISEAVVEKSVASFVFAGARQ
jgi:Fe-S-cluster containining protein